MFTSSSIWLWYREAGQNGSNGTIGKWAIKKVIEIPAEPADPEKLPPILQGFKAVAPLVTDINLSLDDRYLYVSCWGTGEFIQYDVSDPFNPKKNSITARPSKPATTCFVVKRNRREHQRDEDTMSTRSAALAQRIEEGAHALGAYAQRLSDAQWRTMVPPDGRQVGVIIHHVASVYPIEIHLATELASGKPVAGVTWGAVAEMNAKHAREHAAVGKEETLELLRHNSHAAAEAVRAFTDEQLDRAAPVSLNGDAPLTTQFLIEDHALRHSWHHLARIKGVLERV